MRLSIKTILVIGHPQAFFAAIWLLYREVIESVSPVLREVVVIALCKGNFTISLRFSHFAYLLARIILE